MAHSYIRTSVFALTGTATLVGTLGLIARPSLAQVGGSLPTFVRLQASTPGTAQNGHSNITGTSIAGDFVGGGAGLTSVNAEFLGGFDASSFLQSVPVPLLLSGTSANHILRAENASTTTGASAIYGVTTSPSGITYGGRFTSTSTDGVGVLGVTTATSGTNWGGYFGSASTSGYGVLGNASALTGFTTGVYGTSNSPNGQGISGLATSGTGYCRGVKGESYGQTGTGVLGITTTTLEGYGVWGYSSGVIGRGVYGDALSTTGLNYGVYGRSDSIDGRGVYGENVSNSINANGFGVLGYSLAPARWAIYAAGNLGASGVKSFRIDHPSDPKNKYLLHYCAEGPEPRNVYQGRVNTGTDGFAWVDLPDYFQEINKDPLVQLTVVDTSNDFVQVKVSQRVTGNRFQIRTSKGHVEVDWRVDAVRNDRWVQSHGAPVEVEKTGLAKGKYQHPELYGAPPAMGEFYSSQRSVDSGAKEPRP